MFHEVAQNPTRNFQQRKRLNSIGFESPYSQQPIHGGASPEYQTHKHDLSFRQRCLSIQQSSHLVDGGCFEICGILFRFDSSSRSFGHKGTKINNYNAVSVTSRRILSAGIQCLPVRRVGTTYDASVGRDHHQFSFDDEVPHEPFLLSLFKETVWSLRSLFVFLLEQPSQLKYIEWPGFRSTLKTATLTLVLVALLVVALSSTDCPQLFVGFDSLENTIIKY